MASIAEKVARLRAERGWTLKELSERSGISVSHLSAIEKGRRRTPSFQCIDRLSAAFGVSLCYFSERAESTEALNSAGGESPGESLARMTAASTEEAQGGALDPTAEAWQQISRLYDHDTFQFIASERSRPYVSFAKQLAEQTPEEDPSSLLQLIAQFIRDQRERYHAGAPVNAPHPATQTKDSDRRQE